MVEIELTFPEFLAAQKISALYMSKWALNLTYSVNQHVVWYYKSGAGSGPCIEVHGMQNGVSTAGH